jgi:hypothetical protein
MGAVFSIDHLVLQCRTRAGRYGRNLLDLLAYSLGSPLGVTANAVQFRRRLAIKQKPAVTAPAEDKHVST